ncbi:MAG: rhamnosyltransferase [Paracoccaceae bacterium]|jgi:rhamnosyltransferase
MKASVIIPTKNPGPVFRRVIEAVLDQEVSFAFDVLVIDSGSQDGTLGFVEGLCDDRVRLVSIPPATFGHGKTRNLAISKTSGEYAVMLTHDAMPADSHWLANMVSAVEQDDAIAGVFGRHLAYPEADAFTADELERHFEGFRESPIVGIDSQEEYDRSEPYRQFLHFFSDNNALIRRSVWSLYPYPEVDFAEDQLWAKTIIEKGFKKAYSHEGAVFHSHNYRLIERLQRSFDEAYAFRRLFGYRVCGNFSALLRGWSALTFHDARFALDRKVWRTDPMGTLHRLFENLVRVAGSFLGSHGDRLPSKLKKWLSWDNRLLLGLKRST